MSSRVKTSRAATKLATREALITAAAAEFAEKGLEGASLNAISARAGFTRGAFYVHFRDRDDLLIAVMERVLGGFVDVLTAASDAAGDLERIVMTIALAVTAAAAPVIGGPALRFHHILAACERSPVVGARYVALLRQASQGVARAVAAGQAAGSVRTDVDAATLADLLVACALGLISMSEVGVSVDATAIGRTMMTLVGKTGATPEGPAR